MSKPKRILRTSSLKKRNAASLSSKVHLDRVLGFTISGNSCLDTSVDGTLAYPAGCVVVLHNAKKTKQRHIYNVSKKTITALAFSGDGKHLVTGESGHQPAVRVWELETCTQVVEFHGHKFGISCVAFSPNLKYIISIGTQHDMTANVWNWKSNCKIASNKVTSKVVDVAFSEDGSYFVTVGTRHVKFWYLGGTKSRINETVPLMGRAAVLGDHKDNVFCGVACGKGDAARSTFAITRSGLLCELTDKRHVDKWVELRTSCASCLAVTATHIFVGCADGIVRVFSSSTLHYITSLPRPHFLGVDVAAGQDPRHMLSPPPDARYPDTIAISYDASQQKVVCVYKDHSLYVWDVTDIKRVGKNKSYLFHSASIWGLETFPQVGEGATLPEGSFITCGSDDTIRIWNTCTSLSTDQYYKRNIYCFELLSIIYTDPELIFLCEKEKNPGGKTDKTDNSHLDKNGIRSVRVSPEGRHLASGDRTGNIRVHDLRTGQQENFLEAHDSEVLCLEFTDPSLGVNLLASTSRDRMLHVFDREQDYGLVQTLDDHSAAVTAVKFARQEGGELHMISCSVDKSMLFRNAVMDPTFQFVLNRHLVLRNSLYDMTVDPSVKFVATACQDRNVRIYNMKNGKQKACYSGASGTDGTLLRLELDRSGQLLATSCSDKNLAILDFFTGELLATMFGHSEVVTGVKFTNDMKHLISVSGDGCIFMWRLPQDFTVEVQSRRIKLADPTVVTNGDPTSNRRGTFLIPKSVPGETSDGCDSTDLDAEALDNNANMAPEPDKLDYRFSIGALPSWAKKQVLQEPLRPPTHMQGPSQPTGAWAKTLEKGNVPIKSTMDDSIIQLSLADCMGTPVKKTKASLMEMIERQAKDKRRFTVEPDAMASQIRQLQEKARSQVRVITDDDEHNRDDTDDDDEFRTLTTEELEEEMTEGDAENSQLDSSRVNMFRGMVGLPRKESQFDLDPDLEPAENGDVIYMENDVESPGSLSTSFQIFEGDDNSTREIKQVITRRIFVKKLAPSTGSEGTEAPSLDDVSDDESDITTPDTSKVANTPEQEKFLQDNFLKMDMLDDDAKKAAQGHRHSISARFLTQNQQVQLRQQASSATAVNRNATKKKEEVSKAIDESRRKLQALGWRGSCDIKLLMGTNASSKAAQNKQPESSSTAQSRRSTGTAPRRPEPGSDRRKTIGDTIRPERDVLSPLPPGLTASGPGTPERRRWGGSGTATSTSIHSQAPAPGHTHNATPPSPLRKWSSMLDMNGGGSGGGSASSRQGAGAWRSSRSKTPTSSLIGGPRVSLGASPGSGGRALPRTPSEVKALAAASRSENTYGSLRKSAQSRSEKNLLAAVESDDPSEKRKSLNLPDSKPSYMKQTSSSTSKLSRARSGCNLGGKEESRSRNTSPRPPSRNALTPTGTAPSAFGSGSGAGSSGSTNVAQKAAAARRSGAARRERLGANLKGRFRSSPNLNDKAAMSQATEEDEEGGDAESNDVDEAIDVSEDEATPSDMVAPGHRSMPTTPRKSSPPPLSVFPGRGQADEGPGSRDNSPSARELQDRLAMPPPPSVPPPPPNTDANKHSFSEDAGNSVTKLAPVGERDLHPMRNVTPRSTESAARLTPNAAMISKIVQANSPQRIPTSTERTISEINEIARATAAGMSPWHSSRNSSLCSTASRVDSPRTTSSQRGESASLVRSASSDSLDETPVKEERRSKVEMSNIRLASPAPPPLPSQPPPNLPTSAPPAQPQSSNASLKPATPSKTTETWSRSPRPGTLQSPFLARDHETSEGGGTFRRREGEPDMDDRARRFSASAAPVMRPRSSICVESVPDSNSSSPRSARDDTTTGSASISETRGRTGTLLSRNKELLTNLLTTPRDSTSGTVSASPLIPRRHRGSTGGSTSGNPVTDAAAAIKLQWIKQRLGGDNKHPLDLSAHAQSSSSQSSSTSSSAVTSPRSSGPGSSVSTTTVTTTTVVTHRASNSTASTVPDRSVTSSTVNTSPRMVTAQQGQGGALHNGQTVLSPVLGSPASAFHRPEAPGGKNESGEGFSPPVKDSAKPSETTTSKTDRSGLKLDLKKVHHPAHTPDDMKPIMDSLRQHTETLVSLVTEYPELVKPNVRAGEQAVRKLNEAFGLVTTHDLDPNRGDSPEKRQLSAQLTEKFTQKLLEVMESAIEKRVSDRVNQIVEQTVNERMSRVLEATVNEWVNRILEQTLEERLNVLLERRIGGAGKK